MPDAARRPATLALHAGQSADPAGRPRAVPICQTSSFVFDSAEQAAALFALERPGHIYTRITNPTTAVLEDRLAALDGGAAALAVASGQAAVALAVLTLARAGQNIVSTTALYGGTFNLFRHTLARFGIETRFVDTSDASRVEAAVDGQTRLVYTESVGNPRNNVDDLDALAGIAHRRAIPLVVDNTVTPCVFRPFEHGADLIVYSLTKFVGGHGTSIGGAIVDSGRFDWKAGSFPEVTSPEPSYHGLIFDDAFRAGDRSTGYIGRARAVLLRDLGPCLSPFNAFLFLQGVETLPLRMKAHGHNALAVAEWLTANPHVSWVNYPLLPAHPDYRRARQSFPTGPAPSSGLACGAETSPRAA